MEVDVLANEVLRFKNRVESCKLFDTDELAQVWFKFHWFIKTQFILFKMQIMLKKDNIVTSISSVRAQSALATKLLAIFENELKTNLSTYFSKFNQSIQSSFLVIVEWSLYILLKLVTKGTLKSEFKTYSNFSFEKVNLSACLKRFRFNCFRSLQFSQISIAIF